ncbi:hypothetical protein LLG88_13545 [bacterium]|nr:hypothetical protein [bacterium]
MADQPKDPRAGDNTTALARLEESTRGVITDMAVLSAKIREWQQYAHVLSPVDLSALPPQYAARATLVVLDTTVDKKGIGGEIYSAPPDPRDGRGVPWLSAGEAAIGKVGLRRISQAAGITWDTSVGQTDDRKERYLWSFRAVGWYVASDGSRQNVDASFELDLRDGSPALKGFDERQIIQARKNGARVCESKAKNAAIRELGIRQKYTIKDLQKPFVVIRVAFQADPNDPEQRRMVAERGLAGSSALYPNARQVGAGRADDIVVEAKRVETVNTPSGKVDTATGELVGQAQPSNGNGHAAASAAPADAPKPAEPTGPTITNIRLKSDVTAEKKDAQGNITSKGGKPYTRHFITLSDGREVHTFDTNVGKLAKELMEAKAPVDVTTTDSKWGVDIVELRRAQPSLPLDEDGPTDADIAGQY